MARRRHRSTSPSNARAAVDWPRQIPQPSLGRSTDRWKSAAHRSYTTGRSALIADSHDMRLDLFPLKLNTIARKKEV